ncbi:TetR/AcrR family transcriptional regulator [Mycobacterium sp. D16Q16]|uniref:TetR/AcrR family transcriptional regulator n=1 Tax=Mycobacterium sp. D16Q16 TaxID=1855659 RepID=UPI000994605B|nr:TetR/AcrR family transcriptional regulator [Mycobacterium sp. D16Q16]
MTSRQEAILQASAAAIAENGVRGLRVSDVARVAGVSSGLLYYHFRDRDGLLAAALTYINDQARAYRQAASGSGVSRGQLIEHILGEIQDSAAVVENSLVWNELRASAVYEEPLREPLARTSEEWTRETAAAIRAAQDIGEVSETVDADSIALVLNALTEGLASRWLSHELTAAEARAHLRATAELMLPAHRRGPKGVQPMRG